MWKLRWLVYSLLIFICLLLTGCFPNNRSRTSTSGSPDINTIWGVGNAEYITDQVLVRFKPGVKIDEVLTPIHGQILKYNQKLDFYQVRFNKTNRLNVLEAIRILKDSNQVFLAEPNFIYKAYTIPDDPDFPKQWGLEKINAPAGWDSGTGANTVTIAIVDTGIDDAHPDLNGKVILGYNAIYGSAGPPADDNGHGTHCAGIAASISNNGIGMAGVAWQCNLMAVKVLDSDGSGEVNHIAEGIVWAVDNGADVISMSLGGPGYSRLLQNAVDYALSNNVVVVAAAGNGSKLDDNNYPSCYPGVISVAAMNAEDRKAKFSTESNLLFISAPGEQIFSTLPNAQYGYNSGTSMATPFVSGAVALIKSIFGEETHVSQVCSQLKQSAIDLGSSGWDQQTGWGRLNLQGALANLKANEFGKLIVTVNDGVDPVPDAQVLLTDNSTGRVMYNIRTGTNELSLGVNAVSTGQACFWSLPAGSYKITAEKIGYKATATYTVSGGGTTNETISIPFPTGIVYSTFNEAAETSPAKVQPGGTWGKTSSVKHSGSYSWTDSPGKSYINDVDMSLTTKPINFTGSTAPKLHFWQRYNTDYYDYCRVEVSEDWGDTWHSLASWSGIQSAWKEETINLFNYKDQTHLMIRFRFTSNGYTTGDGWYIDDISIIEPPDPISYTTFNETAENTPSKVTTDGAWAKVTTNPQSAPNCWKGSFSGNYSYDAMSLITVPVNMTGSIAPRLHFWQRFETPSATLRVEASTDYGNTWSQIGSWSGTQSTWGEKTIIMDGYKTQTHLMIRFRYNDYGSISNGWYIDDISIAEPPASISYTTFNETAENTPSKVTGDGAWAKVTTNPYSASNCWKGSFSGNYDYDSSMSLITVPVNMTGSIAPRLNFWQRFETPSATLRVEASTDYGNTWNPLGSTWSGAQNTWGEKIISLDGYKTQTHLMIRFRYNDYGSASNGWYIDDISIAEPPASISFTTFNETAENTPSKVTADGAWAKVTTNPHSASNCWKGSFSGNFNSSVSLTLTTVPINMTGSIAPRLNFWQRFETPSTNLRVEASTDYGNTWNPLGSTWRGTQSTWGEKTISLDGYKTQTHLMIRFRYNDYGSTSNGWYIDDLTIDEYPASISYTSFNETAANSPSQVTAEGGWAKVTTTSYSAPNCWKASFSGNNTGNEMSLITVPIDMTGSNAPGLHFWQRYNTHALLQLEVSTDYGNSWSPLGSWSGTQNTWTVKTISLDGYKTQTHLMLRFFCTDSLPASEDWFIDDISITAN